MREDLNKVLCESPRLGGGEFHDYRRRMEDYHGIQEDFEDDIPHKGDSSRVLIEYKALNRKELKFYGVENRPNEKSGPSNALTTDSDLAALEDEVRKLVERAQ